jgi:hypothetical protein
MKGCGTCRTIRRSRLSRNVALRGLSLDQDQLKAILAAVDRVKPEARDRFLDRVGELLRHWSRIRTDMVKSAIEDALHRRGMLA